ncbi:MAG: FadR/GntR family transcriptional regulator [Bacillota bacterium]|jgi:GntR family transcriptional repressor for pyruvate dehydrogenase complex|nr:FadR/GntR family transcriptional regulator [Bacillota bacterium]MDD3297802.1 FadR/GntR family transcriptional regulator [Bacillota bacterium]MDD3850844.1 FadR/GntR family transcriptional regulator [Bacillota bacterium]MDD4707525.1 FadR/GntR family transcriptional regulator [Bacillota bacterium]
MLKPVKKKTLPEEIIEQFKQQIISGNWKPGDRLPPERELSESLGVSRTSVREALSAFTAIGLIEVRVGEGTFLASDIAPLYKRELSSKFLVKRGSLLEVVEARKIVETQLAYLAALRATDEDLNKMEKILDNMGKRIASQSSFMEYDVAFHFAIACAARNTILLETINAIAELFRSVHREVVELPGMPQLSYSLHNQIYEAIKKGSCAEAQEAMMKHLSVVEDRIKNMPLDDKL